MTTKTAATTRVPVKFTNPPVVEVACGVLFSSEQPLLTAHIGAFWRQIESEFPRIQDAAPLANVVEQPGSLPEVAFQFSNLPPLRRAWMLSADGRNLIQLQEDRFLFNWKKASDDDCYPNYEAVYSQFERHLENFLLFCRQMGLGPITPRQFELVYVNHISQSKGLEFLGKDSILVDHTRKTSVDRFLPEPEGFNWTTAYNMDGQGRLHVAAQTALNMPSQEKLVRLDMTARGVCADTSAQARKAWFDVAHDWITFGFADVTSPDLHSSKFWGRTA